MVMPFAIQRRKMFGSYDPGPLLRTAVDVGFSTIFGHHADHRLIEAIAQPAALGSYDYSVQRATGPDGSTIRLPDQPCDEIWIDYATDVGGGWDSTYAVAYYISQQLRLLDFAGREHETKRGGDEVYPSTSRRVPSPFGGSVRSRSEEARDVYPVMLKHLETTA